MLSGAPYHDGNATIGLFGLVGVAGAGAATLAGVCVLGAGAAALALLSWGYGEGISRWRDAAAARRGVRSPD